MDAVDVSRKKSKSMKTILPLPSCRRFAWEASNKDLFFPSAAIVKPVSVLSAAERCNQIKALQTIVSKRSQKPHHSLMRYAELPTLTHTNAPASWPLNEPSP